jgi:hypothetical protein
MDWQGYSTLCLTNFLILQFYHLLTVEPGGDF